VAARAHTRAVHAAAGAAGGPAVMHEPLRAELDVWRATWAAGGFKPLLILRPDPSRAVVFAASDAGDEAVAALAGRRAVWRRLTDGERAASSSLRELLAMRMGVRALCARLRRGDVAHVLCDNAAAASGLARARSRSGDPELDAAISDILAGADIAGVFVVASHVPREHPLVALCDRLASCPAALPALSLLRSELGGGAELDGGVVA